MRIAFLTSAGRIQDLAFTLAAAQQTGHEWVRSVEREIPEADLLISFLNAHVVPADRLGVPAYNVHPGTPDFPGQLPFHFAAYAGSWMAGATLHRMTAAVDAGEIYDVWEQPVDPAGGVRQLLELSKQLALGVLLRHLDAMIAGTLEPSGRMWRVGPRRTQADFDALARIAPDIDPAELQRRLVALASPEQRTPYVEVHGVRFIADPSVEQAAVPPLSPVLPGGFVTPDAVRAFLLAHFEQELAALGMATSELPEHFDLHATGVVDSFGILELIVAIEEHFGLDIDFEELDPEDLTVVGPFSRFVAAAAGAARP